MAYITINNSFQPNTLRDESKVNENFTTITDALASGFSSSVDIAVNTFTATRSVGSGRLFVNSNVTVSGAHGFYYFNPGVFGAIRSTSYAQTDKVELITETCVIQAPTQGAVGEIYPRYSYITVQTSSVGTDIDWIDTSYFQTGDMVFLRSNDRVNLAPGGNISVSQDSTYRQYEVGSPSVGLDFYGGTIGLIFYNSMWHGVMCNPRG